MTQATKQQEREALEQIKKIVENLGPDSYIGTAFDGCFELAEQNIRDDSALSMLERWQNAERKAAELYSKSERLETENKRIAAQLEREQEWKPYEDNNNVSETRYQDLATAGGTQILSEAEAAELIHREFGFDINLIEIVHTVNIYEVNRHEQLRKTGERKRDPLYNATDWNYIRFNVCNWFYEMHNGELRQFID